MLRTWFKDKFQSVVQEDRSFAEGCLIPVLRPIEAYKGKRARPMPIAGGMRGGSIEERKKVPFRKRVKFPTLKCDGEDLLEPKERYPKKKPMSLDWWLRYAPWGGYYPTKAEFDTLPLKLETHANARFLEWAMGFPQNWTEI